MKWLRQGAISLVATLIMTGCSATQQESNSQEPQLRIIAAAAGSAEILSELGFGNQIVGVDERNSALHGSTKVTSGHALNFELVASLKPTIVILDSLTDSRDVERRLKDLKISMLILPTAESIDDIYRKYEILGRNFGREKVAKHASEKLRAKFEALSKGEKSLRIAFLYLRGTNAIYLVGGKGSGADSLITQIGSVDVGAEILDAPFTPLTSEVMKRINPDALLLMKKGYESVGGIEGLSKLPGLSTSNAVKKQQIIVIDDRKLLDFGPATINVIEEMMKQSRSFT